MKEAACGCKLKWVAKEYYDGQKTWYSETQGEWTIDQSNCKYKAQL